jgi:cyclic dehypoxanthinyl futalosine synthase
MSITKPQALDYFRSDDLIGLGMEADAYRYRLHPEGVVTYLLDRNIRFTDFDGESSGSCTFYRPLSGKISSEPYLVDIETIYAQVAETVEMGGTGVLIQGGTHSGRTIEWFEGLLSGLKRRFPQIWLDCFSAPEILSIAQSSNLPLRDTLARLRDAGLDSIAGDGAMILDHGAPGNAEQPRCSTENWVRVHQSAHQLKIRTTAAMMFGAGETCDQLINYLEEVRRVQEATGGFTAFFPWSYRAKSAKVEAWDEATAVEYLKVLAISRLYLDNIENVQSNWAAQGLKVLQLALRFGSNDAGSVLLEESANSTNEEQLRQVIRDAGFKPAQRDTLYTTCFLN